MTAEVIGRELELLRIDSYLHSVPEGPSGLLLQGEAGIGKTLLWQAALAKARGHGYRVMTCRPVESEAQLSYASVADLLAGLDGELFAALPDAQREALEVALLVARPARRTPDHRAVATALLGLLSRIAVETPVLIAIDDMQSLDQASERAIEFAVRRMTGPISLLASVREPGHSRVAHALQLAGSGRIVRLEIGPLESSALHRLLQQRTGRSYSRPALVRIQELSGGNPFFALELVRLVGDRPALAPSTRFPPTIADLGRARLDGLEADLRVVLLAVAALSAPTVEIMQRVEPLAVAQLERAEELDIVEISGSRIRFSHPILASAVYSMASPAQRRAMHLRLATAGLDTEERARHLALAALSPDSETIAALDAAASVARARGAPATAADLLEMALALGAIDGDRRLRAARHHFDSGDPLRARAILEETIGELPAGRLRAEAARLLATVRLHDDSYQEAALLLEQALTEAEGDQALQAAISLELNYVLTNLGRVSDAFVHAELLVADAEELGDRGLIAQALAAALITGFLNGQGLDERRLKRALVLEDSELPAAVMFRPSLMASLLWMWTGRLDEARTGLYLLRSECLEKGEETDLMFVAFHLVMLECWRGDLASARAVADDAYERALQLGTDVPLAIALSIRANAAAHEGNAGEARETAEAALAIFVRGSCLVATLWPMATLGFLELSLDEFGAAANRLAPMAAGALAMGVREPVCIPFAADAAEALVALGRTEEAATIVDQLEQHGHRLDRAWALANGGRCRALLLGAEGRLTEAIEAARAALEQHARLAMPFDRARTLLVLGRLLRRDGQRKAARTALQEAHSTFTGLGTTLWAEKARGELARAGLHPGPASDLTPSERRVAELTARGLTNREVAAALLVSAKTVEANLSRAYRKLGIRSRAELGRLMAQPLGK